MANYLNHCIELLRSGSIFWFCALAGSGIFAIQFFINLLGGTSQDTLETSDTSDYGKFKWFSMQALAGFLMTFGWTALTCQSQFSLPLPSTLTISLLTATLAALAILFLFRAAKKLHSSGTTFNLQDAIGKEAYVYQSIPKGGIGKISVSLHQVTYEIDAISQDSEELVSFTPVKIIEKKDNTTLIVSR